jgi:hypothetical protein
MQPTVEVTVEIAPLFDRLQGPTVFRVKSPASEGARKSLQGETFPDAITNADYRPRGSYAK